MNWLEVVKTFFLSIIGVSKAVEVRTKPQEIQVGEFNEEKELRIQDDNQEMINDDFQYLKRRTEIDIDNYLRRVHPDMSNIERHIQVVTERVYQFRYDHPIKYAKWIKANPKP